MKTTISLKKSFQFRYVYNKGKSIANKHLVMYFIKNNKNINRLGLSVSKKVGNSVVRSRVTRLIKENYRLSEDTFKVGFDIVIIARPLCKEEEFKVIGKSLIHILKKQDLIK